MATNQETQNLEETLNKTDLGHVINENKKAIMAGFAILLTAIIAYSVNKHFQTQNKMQTLDKAFEVEQNLFKPFIAEEVKAEEFKKSLLKMNGELIGQANLVPIFLESINKLDEKGLVDQSIVDVVEKWKKNISKSNLLSYFVSVRLAALYEDAGKIEEAINTLELLISKNTEILKNKIYLDLARLYVKSGDKVKAKERLDTLMKQKDVKGTDLEKMAMFLLSEMEK